MGATGFQIELNDEAIKKAIAESILAMLDGPTRERLIERAIAYLLDPSKGWGGYDGRREAIVESVFRDAMTKVAREVATEYVETHPDVRARVEQAIHEAATRLIAGNRAAMDAAASALVDAIRSER